MTTTLSSVLTRMVNSGDSAVEPATVARILKVPSCPATDGWPEKVRFESSKVSPVGTDEPLTGTSS